MWLHNVFDIVTPMPVNSLCPSHTYAFIYSHLTTPYSHTYTPTYIFSTLLSIHTYPLIIRGLHVNPLFSIAYKPLSKCMIYMHLVMPYAFTAGFCSPLACSAFRLASSATSAGVMRSTKMLPSVLPLRRTVSMSAPALRA